MNPQKMLTLSLALLFLSSISFTSAVAPYIAEQPFDVQWQKDRSQALRVSYKAFPADGESGTEAVWVTTPVHSYDDTCNPGSTSGGANSGGLFWNEGEVIVDVRSRVAWYLAQYESDAAWSNPNVAFDVDVADGNPYVCFLFHVVFKSTGGSKDSDQIRIKVFLYEIREGELQEPLINSLPIPWVTTILAFTTLIFLKFSKKSK